jgi:anhydro-N-acetylmuramic acid kinase
MRIAGVMTGTSCDGLDLSCAELSGPGDAVAWKSLWSASAPYPPELRRRVLAMQAPGARHALEGWLKLNRDLGRWYAGTIARLLARHRPLPQLIANHGQTLAHAPGAGYTLQLGDPSLIAARTGLSVACQFREGDVAAGGQGAPLVPRFHAVIARELGAPARAVAIHNLGGISNLSYFGPGSRRDGPLAFDTGPGNLWIDGAAGVATRGRQAMDRGGRLARAGTPDPAAVRALLRNPYFARRPPKSTGRSEFPLRLLLERCRARDADLVATATAVTAESIARAYWAAILGQGRPLEAIYFCGGGAKNPALLEEIRRRLPGVGVRTTADAGIDPQYVEAQAFAYAGYRALLGLPQGGAWTGSRGFGPPAHLVPGLNWSRLLSTVRETRSRP